MNINIYINLLEDFVCHKISADDFERIFLRIFKSETNFSSKLEFQILDKLFGDVDAYCSDPELIDPEYDITEEELKFSAKEALDSLVLLRHESLIK
jgi:hypothetical protein